MHSYNSLIEQIVERHANARLWKVMDPADVAQDVRISVCRALAGLEFPNEVAFRGWITTVARNRLIDLDRKHFQTQRRIPGARSLDETVDCEPGGDSFHVGDGLASDDPTASWVYSRRESAENLERVLEKLSPSYRQVIRWTFVEQVGLGEIAARMEKTPDAVRKLLTRALEACREQLRRDGQLAPREEGRP